MDMIEEKVDIEFISLYGHLAYSLSCPHCGESFEKHSVIYPKEVVCPYCKTAFSSPIPMNQKIIERNSFTYLKKIS